MPLHALRLHLSLGATLLLATVLRFYRLGGQSLWSDEGNSVALAQAGLAKIAARTALDIHPPLYYWWLHIWIKLLGQSEVAVRSLSAVMGVLLVAIIYRLGAKFFNRRAGLLAAFIAAVSPFQIYYAQETRMYALLALLGAVTVWAALELIERRSKLSIGWALCYVFGVTLGLYTHYAFPVVLIATNAAFLLHLRRDRGGAQRLLRWLALQLIPLVLYTPWMPVAWRQITTWPAPSSVSTGGAFLALWRTLLFGPTAEAANELWLIGFGLLIIIGIIYLAWREPLPQTTLLLLYLMIPMALTLVLFKPAYLKFLLIAHPALCLLLAFVWTVGRSARATMLMGVLGAALTVAAAWNPLSAYYTNPTFARDDYRGMARYLEAMAGPEDAIILNAAGQQEVFGYYYRGDTPLYPLPRRRPPDEEATIGELKSILARARHIYALYWATEESDPAGVVEGWLDEHALKATDVWMGNVRLVSYATPLPASDLLPANIHFGHHITLSEYQLLLPSSGGDADSIRPGEIVQVQLRWRTDAPLNTRYVVFAQALDAANHLAGQRDAEPAISTADWLPNQPILDRHGLLIEPGTPPGEHRIIIGLYDANNGGRLPSVDGDFAELGRITVERPATPTSSAALRFRHAVNAELGELRLLGYERYKLGHRYDPETPLHAADALHVVLYWQALVPPEKDWRVKLGLAPTSRPNSAITEGIFPAAGIDYPTTTWQAGEVVRAQFDLFLPGELDSGDYRVVLRLVNEAGMKEDEALLPAPIPVE